MARLLCRFGIHTWSKDCEKCSGCEKIRKFPHEWEGCKCSNCAKRRNVDHEWEDLDGYRCSRCGALKDLRGKTVVAAASSMLDKTASERDRCFFCVSQPSDDRGKAYDGVFEGFWLVDGTKGATAFFKIEQVYDRTPDWAIKKYPRIASIAR